MGERFDEQAVVHRCPTDGSKTPCCGKTVWELPRSDRITADAALTTCWTGGDPRLRPAGGDDRG